MKSGRTTPETRNDCDPVFGERIERGVNTHRPGRAKAPLTEEVGRRVDAGLEWVRWVLVQGTLSCFHFQLPVWLYSLSCRTLTMTQVVPASCTRVGVVCPIHACKGHVIVAGRCEPTHWSHGLFDASSFGPQEFGRSDEYRPPPPFRQRRPESCY